MVSFALLLCFGVTLGLTQRFCDPTSRLHILDYPNHRSLHRRPIPRSGGVAILAGIAIGTLAAFGFNASGSAVLLMLSIALSVGCISFLEDRHGVHLSLRITVHFLAALMLYSLGYSIASVELPGLSWMFSPSLAFIVSILFVVWMINLYNFMDGMDGFASGMGIIGFGSFAMLGWQAGDATFASASLLIASACLGFLVFNFPPAKIFLGDTGSSTLGFFVAGYSLWAAQANLFPLWVAGLIFSPFIIDATVTLGYRLLTGEKIWLPHKTHYYQKLVQRGWGHRRTLLAEYALMLGCSGSAILATRLAVSEQALLLTLWLLIYGLLMVGVHRIERRTTHSLI